ncbi:MAG: hypothetical protein HC925_07015 [Coleofasciculaceae cyanobacterium SM2_3_26]|nr:hypothetical protein [Coleofasciculaceae cyanobacterium SM2_3_26]
MFVILFIVIAMVAWSLHLMQEAFERKEFSLMLAGTLVAASAAAMMLVYFLMCSYMGYIAEVREQPCSQSAYAIPEAWISAIGE